MQRTPQRNALFQPFLDETLEKLPAHAVVGAALIAVLSTTAPALASDDVVSPEGLKSVTQSQLGQSVRRSVVGGAQLVDSLDLKWERLSDAMRDENKCDPVTGRRLLDNGFRRDGTRIGNPVLGALCTPEPLRNLDTGMAKMVLDKAQETAVELLGQDRATLQRRVDELDSLIGSSFTQAADINNEQATQRENYNKDVYTQLRAYGEAMGQKGGMKYREASRLFDKTWGRKLLVTLAPSASRDDFQSPFPKPDPTDEQPYDEGALLDALGSVSVALNKLRDGGLVGHWEISIPEDDSWNVVTIAVDDDISIGGQILSRERNQALSGSTIVALVRSALEDQAKISFKLDTFFIDPTTTRQELYNPTQLLISLRDVGQ